MDAPVTSADHLHLLAYGKVNLAINVGQPRPDGYHEVEMVLHRVPVYDHLNFYIRSQPGISLKSNLSYLRVDDHNLVVRAYEAMQQAFSLPGVTVHLFKKIPISAGMAGGSADAAMTIRGLNELFQLGLSLEKEMEIGARLGSDIPFCLYGASALARGRGEKLSPFPLLPPCTLVFAKPNFGVSTRLVYQQYSPEGGGEAADIPALAQKMEAGDIAEAARLMRNQLESVVFPLRPVVRELRDYLMELGALGSRMSGSGPTVFGIFDDKEKAFYALQRLKVRYPRSYRFFMCEL